MGHWNLVPHTVLKCEHSQLLTSLQTHITHFLYKQVSFLVNMLCYLSEWYNTHSPIHFILKFSILTDLYKMLKYVTNFPFFDVRKSIHHHTIQIIQPTRCNSFTSLLLDVYVWLNMCRASPRPSSGAYSCTRSLWFYRWREAAEALLVVVWQVPSNKLVKLLHLVGWIIWNKFSSFLQQWFLDFLHLQNSVTKYIWKNIFWTEFNGNFESYIFFSRGVMFYPNFIFVRHIFNFSPPISGHKILLKKLKVYMCLTEKFISSYMFGCK